MIKLKENMSIGMKVYQLARNKLNEEDNSIQMFTIISYFAC